MSDADSVDVGWGATAKAGTTDVPERLWQVNTRGRKVAEMTLAELTTNVKSGKLGARTLVWCDGMPAWTPLGEVRELERLTRADSDPPASGARFIGDEPELVAGTKSYVSLGSEPPTDPGTLAIYERPLATIEFPDAIELVPESVDEPTPAFNPPSLMSARATLPGLAPEDLVPLSSRPHAAPEPPPAPPLPPRPQAGFPSPVTASPLGAALSAMSGSNPSATPLPATRSRPQHDVPNSYAVAKATPIPSLSLNALVAAAADAAAAARPLAQSTTGSATAAKSKPEPSPAGGAALRPAALAPANPVASKKPFAETLQSSQPPAPTVTSSRGSVTISSKTAPASSIVTVSSTPLPSANAASAAAQPAAPTASNAASNGDGPPTQPAAAANAKSASFVPPRPAIEFLPPIIVQEKEDDGASIITLPLGAKPPLDADFHESTLVLAGRRRPRRWVPLGAAVAACVGSACLASALTALLVNSRPPVTRVVEKKVFVPAAPAAAPALSEAAPAATTTASAHRERAATSPPSDAEKPAVSEHAPSKNESSAPSTKTWRKDDPGALDQSSPSTPRRSGFPTNPGF